MTVRPRKRARVASFESSKLPLETVEAARSLVDPLKTCRDEVCALENMSLTVHAHRGNTVSARDRSWIFNCVKQHLSGMYTSSGVGWHPAEKRRELCSPFQHFLIVKDHSQIDEGRLAFLSYRYDVEDSVPVVYVYELFVDRRGRRQGLATLLMRIVESLALKSKIHKAMLTVFNANVGALNLYRAKLG